MPRGALARGLERGLLFALLALHLGCSPRPPSAVAQGSAIACEAADFHLTAPQGWRSRVTRGSIALTRELPYGGGYPTVNVRRLEPDEALAQAFEDGQTRTPGGRASFRYQRWGNARGRGYRLDVLLETGSGWLAIDASVWDEAQSLDQRFFNEQFWPIVNSVVDDRPGPAP